MTSVLPAPHLLRAWTVLGVGAIVVVSSVYGVGSELLPLLVTHRLTVAVFVVAIVAGELLRLPMPSGRAAAPLASASALALVFLSRIDGEPTFDVPAGFVVLVVLAGLLVPAAVRGVEGKVVGLEAVAARLVGVAVAAWLAREFAPSTRSLRHRSPSRSSRPDRWSRSWPLPWGCSPCRSPSSRSPSPTSPSTATCRTG
jgi:uncharacterized membrane protein YoaK (UPF0700 family)